MPTRYINGYQIMKLENIPSKYHKYVLVIAITLSSLAISIRSSNGKVKLILQDYPLLIFLMIIISSLLVVLYIRLKKKKIENLSSQIKAYSNTKDNDFNILLSELTLRQKEVYDLIISGKTNKEIMSQLFIEQSTLKSHINQIYKKLNIKNRKELRTKLNH